MQIHIIKFKNPKQCNLYQEIKQLRKTVEGRKYSVTYNKINVNDMILLDCKPLGILACSVTYINLYQDVEEYLRKEGLNKTLGNCVKNIRDGLLLYSEYVTNDTMDILREKYGYGFMGIGVKLIKEYNYHIISVDQHTFNDIINEKQKMIGILNKRKYNINDILIFTNNNKESEKMRITKVNKYSSFMELEHNENIKNIKNKNEQDEINYGVIAIYFELFE